MAASRRPGTLQRRPEARLIRAARRVLAWERARRTRVDVTLLEAAAMRRLNRTATGRRSVTDVIAFTLPQPDGTILGDVYVCLVDRHRDPDEELLRLAVHGTLHVLGYDHPAGPSRTRSKMWRKQEAYVRRLAARSA